MQSAFALAGAGAWVESSLRGVYTSVAAVGSPSPVAIYLEGAHQPMQAGTLMDLTNASLSAQRRVAA